MKRILPILAIFMGSMLSFGIEPLLGNTLLPFFGGTAAVWTVCLSSFQILLLVGYFYAHALPTRRVGIHVVLVALASIWVLGIAFYRTTILSAVVGWHPSLATIFIVLFLVGAPYVLLSANSSLVQSLVANRGGKDVYRLYAVSNAGSLAGLLLYPLVLEPFVSLNSQWLLVSVGLLVYAFVLGGLAFHSSGDGTERRRTFKLGLIVGTISAREVEWIFLGGLSCFILNAVTTHTSLDVTPIPLLWVVLLACYLLSWIVWFGPLGEKWGRWLVVPLLPLILGASFYLGDNAFDGFFRELAFAIGFLLIGCGLVHARLYRVRPSEDSLTAFYFWIALGGAIGGLMSSIGCPLVFTFVAEYPLALCGLLAVVVLESSSFLLQFGVPAIPRTWLYGAMTVVAVFGCIRAMRTEGNVLARTRNFYAVSQALDMVIKIDGGRDYRSHAFQSNGTTHGFQVAEDGWTSLVPTCYYTEEGGGSAIVNHPKRRAKQPLRVAFAGMGIGTLAAFGEMGDLFRFYEINPDVADFAQNTNLFTFVSRSRAKVEIVVDDARRALEIERMHNEEKWDVIVLDVFNGDSIPPHMATKEAFQLYLDRLAPDGVLAFHLTSWHLELSPMVKAAAREFNLKLQGFLSLPDRHAYTSYWAILSREDFTLPESKKHHAIDYSRIKDISLMTDDFHSLLPYLSVNPLKDL